MHVIEAKARQDYPTNNDRLKWKRQATTIRSIDGNTPVTNSYVLAWIDNIYSADFIDPFQDDNNDDFSISIEFEEKSKLTEAKIWQEWKDSNPRPAVLETAALPD